MAKKDEHPIRDGIIIAVCGSLIVAGVLWLIPKAFDFVKSLFVFIWNYLITKSVLPNYLVFLLIGLSLFTVFGKIVLPLFNRKRKDSLSWKEYQRDSIFGANWVWNYSNGHIDQDSIFAFCPHCGLRLVVNVENSYSAFSNEITHLICENCNKTIITMEGSLNYILGRVAREIERRINIGEWKKAVATIPSGDN